MHPLSEDLRDPEDRLIDETNPLEKKDKMLDKTIADTFPASDPPSSLPDPDEDSFAAAPHSSVTDFTRFLGRSTSRPFSTAM